MERAVTVSFKVWGFDGHRIKESFGKSEIFNFSEKNEIRIIEIQREDLTKTNDYVIVNITRATEQECYKELEGQLSDGIFENCRYGEIEEIAEDHNRSIDLITTLNYSKRLIEEARDRYAELYGKMGKHFKHSYGRFLVSNQIKINIIEELLEDIMEGRVKIKYEEQK